MSRPKESSRALALKAILHDPAASPEARVQAARLLEQIAGRKDRQRRRRAEARAKDELRNPAAAPEPTSEDLQAVCVEIDRRIAEGAELASAVTANRRHYFEANPSCGLRMNERGEIFATADCPRGPAGTRLN